MAYLVVALRARRHVLHALRQEVLRHRADDEVRVLLLGGHPAARLVQRLAVHRALGGERGDLVLRLLDRHLVLEELAHARAVVKNAARDLAVGAHAGQRERGGGAQRASRGVRNALKGCVHFQQGDFGSRSQEKQSEPVFPLASVPS